MKAAAGSASSDDLALAAILSVGSVAGATWLGAQLAALITARRTLSASVGDGFAAMVRLPATPSDPAAAWGPAGAGLPGPIVYWTCTAIVFSLFAVAAWLVVPRLLDRRVGADRSARLGVAPEARLARRRDLRPLIVDGPEPGRFVMGKVGRHLVATEDRHSQTAEAQAKRHRTRVGDRSAVVVVGPSRCGKTANVTAGVLDWDGPAVLSSVKDDLYQATIVRRRQLGDVFVFDPFGELPADLGPGVQRVGWSPLQASRSISGAQQAASTLLDAGPTEGVTNASYWSTKGQQLLWPMLFAASISGRSMGDIVRWLALQDGGSGQPSEVAKLLAEVAQRRSGRVAMEAKLALTAFRGFWLLDGRTRSDIFSTAQTVITAWEDPYIAAASATSVTADGEICDQPTMNLRLLLEGNNTLYLVQPLKSVERFAVVFGGLLGDLLRDQAYEISRQAGEPIPPTLAVIDEAGNTPLRWLPDVASTCSGIGIQLVTVWQSLAQMRAIYQAQTGSLLTNHGSKIFFSGLSDRETLEYASYLGGDEEVAQHSTTTDIGLRGDRRTVASSTTSMRLLPGDLLRQVPPGSALLLHGTLPPAHLSGRRPWEEKRLVALASGQGDPPAEVERSERLLNALRGKTAAPPVVVSHLRQMTDALPVDSTPPKEQASKADDGDSDRVVEMLGRLRRADTVGRSLR
ncbi:MAG: type IV secretory system conjugative DNA transfer family protein [Actinomycetota bacterium]